MWKDQARIDTRTIVRKEMNNQLPLEPAGR